MNYQVQKAQPKRKKTVDIDYKGYRVRELPCGYTIVILGSKVIREFVTLNPDVRFRQAKECVDILINVSALLSFYNTTDPKPDLQSVCRDWAKAYHVDGDLLFDEVLKQINAAR